MPVSNLESFSALEILLVNKGHHQGLKGTKRDFNVKSETAMRSKTLEKSANVRAIENSGPKL